MSGRDRGAGIRSRPRTAFGAAIAIALLTAANTALAQQSDSMGIAEPRPFVEGGYDDKPYLTGIFGRIAVGGSVDFHAVWKQADGATEEAGFNLKRWNLLTHTNVSPQVDVWAEVEFEDGGEEIRLELAQIDFRPYTAAGLRCGMLLLPLGRFNLAHDGPRNEFTERPLVATDLMGSALSMPGVGLLGQWPMLRGSRATYEVYAVNGYTNGIIINSPDGTRLPAGRFNFEDQNARPAAVGRLAWDAGEAREIGVSGYSGVYNITTIDGLVVEESRRAQVGALDARAHLLGLEWNGEGEVVLVDIPPGLAGIYASRQAGFFLETRRVFRAPRMSAMPAASWSLAARVEGVDFDRDLAGDSIQQVTVGAHFRPTPDSVFKFDYLRGRQRDRFNNPSETAALLFSLATYF